jgi:hypothetical protein
VVCIVFLLFCPGVALVFLTLMISTIFYLL